MKRKILHILAILATILSLGLAVGTVFAMGRIVSMADASQTSKIILIVIVAFIASAYVVGMQYFSRWLVKTATKEATKNRVADCMTDEQLDTAIREIERAQK